MSKYVLKLYITGQTPRRIIGDLSDTEKVLLGLDLLPAVPQR